MALGKSLKRIAGDLSITSPANSLATNSGLAETIIAFKPGHFCFAKDKAWEPDIPGIWSSEITKSGFDARTSSMTSLPPETTQASISQCARLLMLQQRWRLFQANQGCHPTPANALSLGGATHCSHLLSNIKIRLQKDFLNYKINISTLQDNLTISTKNPRQTLLNFKSHKKMKMISLSICRKRKPTIKN